MKDFLLICDKNCAAYKEMFPLFKESLVSFGSPVKEYNHKWKGEIHKNTDKNYQTPRGTKN